MDSACLSLEKIPLEEILTLATNLIKLRSTENNNTALNEAILLAKKYLSQFTHKMFTAHGKPSLLVQNAKPDTTKFKLILNAHLDVVPGNKKQFEPLIKNGKLYSRGSYDMKAAAAVMIVLFKELAQTVNYPFALQLVTDEEIGGYNGTKYQIEKGISADFVIAGKNTNGYIRNKSKSILWIKIKIYGKTAHAAYPWMGENAFRKMYFFLKEVEKKYPIPATDSWKTTINVAKIETQNTAFNKIPDECTAWLDIRVVPEEEQKILGFIKKILPKGSEIIVEVQDKGAYTDPNNSYVLKIKNAVKQITNKKGKLSEVHGASDVRFYNTLGNVPGVEFGPKGSGAHADDEWVDINSLDDYYQILKQFLLSIK